MLICMRSHPTLKRWFRVLNAKWFDNALPDDTYVFYDDVKFSTARHKRTYAEADWKTVPIIRINPALREQGWTSVIKESLLHEMAHLEEQRRYGRMGDHDENWEVIMRELALRGAFSKRNGISNYSLW